jgi:RNA polymerase sigma factor (sigma-70 family)
MPAQITSHFPSFSGLEYDFPEFHEKTNCRSEFYSQSLHIISSDDEIRKQLFQKVYADHGKEIFAYIRKFLIDDEASEDIFQETFIVFLRKVNLEMADTARSFLYSIARSLALKHLNKQKRFTHANLDLLTDNNKSSNDAEKIILRDQVLAHLREKNPVYGEIYVMRVESAMKLEEISDLLKIPQRSLNRRVQEMKEILYHLLSEGAGHEPTA